MDVLKNCEACQQSPPHLHTLLTLHGAFFFLPFIGHHGTTAPLHDRKSKSRLDALTLYHLCRCDFQK